jgi:hypothetical protein
MHRRLLIIWKTAVLLSACPAISVCQVLDVPEVIQEQDQWCWAAVCGCVLGYYGTPLSQCAIADYTRTHATWHDFGAVNCCEDPKKKCNYWNYNYGSAGSIQAILENWGVKNAGTAKPLTIAKMQSELGAGRPFIVRWAYPDGGGHFIVGHGIADSSVYYMNPWFGEGLKIAKYKWVVSTSGHTWAETNVMSTGLPTAVLTEEKTRPVPGIGVTTGMKGALSINYAVPAAGYVEIGVYSLRGELLRTVCSGFHLPGRHSKHVAGGIMAPGNCLLSMRAGNGRATTILFHNLGRQ